MEPPSLPTAALSDSTASRAARLANLPHEVAERLLGLLELKERLRLAPVSKPFAVLCHSPELLRDVDTGPLESLEALQSFEAWVRKHGQHMRRLSFDCSAARRDALSGQVDSAFSACLEAAGAAAGPSLVQLTAVRSGIGTHSTEWLPAFPSLRRLELRGLLRISPAICSLTALESLHLQGFSVVFEEEVSLPPSLTQLHLRTPFAYELPDQVVWLPRLARLKLHQCPYLPDSYAQLSRLSGSLTRLDIESGPPPPNLYTLTGLRHLCLLDCHRWDSGYVATSFALQHMAQLTCLVLSGGRASPAALRGLCGLQRYYLDQWGEGPGNAELPEGPWLAGLRWLGSSAGSLVLSTAALSAAPSLELVEVVASNSKAVDWSSPAAANFFDWLARHPPLHRVLLRKKYGATVFDAPAFEAHVEQLRLRRPGLLLERVGPTEGTMQALLTDE